MRLTALSVAVLLVPAFAATGRAADADPQSDVATVATRTEISLVGHWQGTFCRVTPSDIEVNWHGDGPILQVEAGRLRATKLPELREWRQYTLDHSVEPPRIRVDEGDRLPALRGTITFDGDEFVIELNGRMRKPFLPRSELGEAARVKWREETNGVEMQRVLRLRPVSSESMADPPAGGGRRFILDVF